MNDMSNNIDLSKFKLVGANSIKRKIGKSQRFVDVTVENDNTFQIIGDDNNFLYLTHNCDGGHITALLVNMFFKWFPYIIDEGSLFRLKIPLISVGEAKKREYFFDMTEFEEWQKGKRQSSTLRYLKGLGSLAEEDWEVIMNNKQLQQIRRDPESQRYLEMAFGKDAMPRKKWLRGEFN